MAEPNRDAASFGFLLSDISRMLRKDFERRVAHLGLTLTQWRAIAQLARQEGINQATLADRLEVSPISLTRMIDRMEKAGWVERRPDPADRRAVSLHLTRKVQPLLESMYEAGAEANETALRGISRDARGRLQRALEQVKGNLREGPP